MRIVTGVSAFLVAFLLLAAIPPGAQTLSDSYLIGRPAAGPKGWPRTSRIAATDLWTEMSDKEIAAAVDKLAAQGVNAVDLDLSYEPNSVQVIFMRRVLAYARNAHPSMRFFVYQAPLEIVTENVDRDHNGVVDPGKTSTFKEHPEWAQRGLGGEPAVFYGAAAQAFWVGKNDEDVWLCPNDPVYRELWKADITRLAETGIDGIYIDVPFFRGWFDEKRDWRWACACSDCAAIYLKQYGIAPPSSANWNDPNFRRFVRWRFTQIENFIAALRTVVRKANRKARLIIEHWDGITDSTETACDPAMIAKYSDVRTHEWTNVAGSTAGYNRYSWIEDAVRFLYYRAVDGKQPTWILGYSKRKDSERMKAFAALQLTAGCNFWETDAPDMIGSVDVAARTELFNWIAAKQNNYYGRRISLLANVALFYSRDSIVFYDFRNRMEPWRSSGEFLGVGMMLLQSHIPFAVVTSGDLDSLNGFDVLILPGAAAISDTEGEAIDSFLDAGGTVVATGETGEFDENGQPRGTPLLDTLNSSGNGKIVRTTGRYGYDFYTTATPGRKKSRSPAKAESIRKRFVKDVWNKVNYQPVMITESDPFTILIPYAVAKSLQVRVFRIDGIASASTAQVTIKLRIPAGKQAVSASWLPYLGQEQSINAKTEGVYSSLTVTLQKHGIATWKIISAK